MFRPRLIALGALTAAVTLAAALPGALAATSPSAPTSRTVATITTCTGRAAVRPRVYVLTCGDANTALSHLRWTGLGGPRASATGTEILNTCTPDCVAGRFIDFPVAVVAERRAAAARTGTPSYHELVVRAGAGRPAGVAAVQRYTPIRPGR